MDYMESCLNYYVVVAIGKLDYVPYKEYLVLRTNETATKCTYTSVIGQ